MQRQIGRVCEAAAAFVADVGPLTSVYAHVLPQVGGLCEGFGAHGADVRFETQMHILVSTQATGVLEGLGAAVTRVGALASVLAQVVLVVGAPFEGEGAVGALEGTESCVNAAVNLQMNDHICPETMSNSSL